MSEEQHRKVRNIIRWQRIGCIVVKISETLKVSLKEALDLSRRKTEWNDKQSYDTVINTTEHFLLALPHSKG